MRGVAKSLHSDYLFEHFFSGDFRPDEHPLVEAEDALPIVLHTYHDPAFGVSFVQK